jgi:hypothetical protein
MQDIDILFCLTNGFYVNDHMLTLVSTTSQLEMMDLNNVWDCVCHANGLCWCIL